jgi:acyl-CoA thioester hydrolase
VRAEVWFSELKNVTARMQHRFYNGRGELAASGVQRGLFVLKETMRPHRPGAEQMAALSRFLEPAG